MDGFTTNVVAPVVMASMSRNDKDEKKRIDQKEKEKKIKKEDTFEEQFGAIYVHSEDHTPITYGPPKKRTFTY